MIKNVEKMDSERLYWQISSCKESLQEIRKRMVSPMLSPQTNANVAVLSL